MYEHPTRDKVSIAKKRLRLRSSKEEASTVGEGQGLSIRVGDCHKQNWFTLVLTRLGIVPLSVLGSVTPCGLLRLNIRPPAATFYPYIRKSYYLMFAKWLDGRERCSA